MKIRTHMTFTVTEEFDQDALRDLMKGLLTRREDDPSYMPTVRETSRIIERRQLDQETVWNKVKEVKEAVGSHRFNHYSANVTIGVKIEVLDDQWTEVEGEEDG